MNFHIIYKLFDGMILPIGIVYGLVKGLPYIGRALGRRFSR